MATSVKTIAVIGGTGPQGRGLALRWAAAGHRLIIGSRDASKAKETARSLLAFAPEISIEGAEAISAASKAEIVALTVPYAVELQIALSLGEVLKGKILIDVTVPLVPPKVSRVQLPADDSCVIAVQQALGNDVKVVSAFQNVSAHKLSDLQHQIACDVLVCSDFKDARDTVIELAQDAGLRGIDAGPLANSTAAEALTSLLIWINRTYKVPDAGLVITGLK
jgi:8-hydroxy-5-deazaflavin:NADPH oxidoreductase